MCVCVGGEGGGATHTTGEGSLQIPQGGRSRPFDDWGRQAAVGLEGGHERIGRGGAVVGREVAGAPDRDERNLPALPLDHETALKRNEQRIPEGQQGEGYSYLYRYRCI